MKKIKFGTVLTVIIFLYFNETKKKCFVYIAYAKHCWVIKLGKWLEIVHQINQ